MLLLLPPRSRTPPKSAPSTTALASRLVFVPPNDDNNTNNNRQERILRFTKHTIAVGRDDDQDLRIKCDLISRNHLAIHIDPVLLEARLRLLGVNPIELNGRTITPSDSSDAWHALHHGDCISFLTKKNKKTFRFELELPSDHVGLHRRPSPPDHTLPSSPLSSLSSLSPQSSPLSGNNNNTPPPRPRSANSKSVSFGPPLRPQIFDKDCPSLHTLSRGESPHSPCPLSPSASSPLSTTTTKTPRSILRKPLSTSTTIKRPTPFFTKANRHPLSISTTRTLPAVAATDPSDVPSSPLAHKATPLCFSTVLTPAPLPPTNTPAAAAAAAAAASMESLDAPRQTYPLSYLRDLVRKAKLPKQNDIAPASPHPPPPVVDATVVCCAEPPPPVSPETELSATHSTRIAAESTPATIEPASAEPIPTEVTIEETTTPEPPATPSPPAVGVDSDTAATTTTTTATPATTTRRSKKRKRARSNDSSNSSSPTATTTAATVVQQPATSTEAPPPIRAKKKRKKRNRRTGAVTATPIEQQPRQ